MGGDSVVSIGDEEEEKEMPVFQGKRENTRHPLSCLKYFSDKNRQKKNIKMKNTFGCWFRSSYISSIPFLSYLYTFITRRVDI
jgi:hypothetical protein